MPSLIVRLESLRHNLAVIYEACRRAKADCMFVFKEAALHPDLMHSILQNSPVAKLGIVAWPGRTLSVSSGIQLHHISSPAFPELVANFHTVYLGSESALCRLSEVGGVRRPSVRFTYEAGDGREGAFSEELPSLFQKAAELGFPVSGLSLNFACFSSNPVENDVLAEAGRCLSVFSDRSVDISAGGTDVLELAAGASLPDHIREIRCGTGVMLGIYPLSGHFIPDARQDCFRLEGRVLECREKEGRKLALFDFGVFHTRPDSLRPSLPGMIFHRASSVYSAFDVTDCPVSIHEGQVCRFDFDYRSLAGSLISSALPMKEERSVSFLSA